MSRRALSRIPTCGALYYYSVLHYTIAQDNSSYYTNIYIYIYTHIMYISTYIYIKHTYMHVYIYIYIYTYMCIYTHTHIPAHIHIYYRIPTSRQERQAEATIICEEPLLIHG